jgi:exodeoxyribonuclease V
MTELTPQQEKAIEAIRQWFDGTPGILADPFRLFGPAGTGKTTLARSVPDALGLTNVHYAAYTGKAASVLRGKGCSPAGTLHSLVYKPMASAETAAKLRAARSRLTDADNWRQEGAARGEGQDWLDAATVEIAELEAEVKALEKESKTIGWEWNPDSPLADAELLICDEVSMVDAKLAADIERFEVPVLVLGDPEQLEPVGGEGYYIDALPDYALTEIHRQALESPVLELATRVRTSEGPTLGLMPDDTEKRSLARAMEHDQVICWRNSTRWSLIDRMRTALGRTKGLVVASDRIMCLTNNRTLGIFNGQQFDVLESKEGPLGPEMMVRELGTDIERRMLSFSDGFQGRARQDAAKSAFRGGRGNRGLFTFANAITCHKAQGSEWGSVYVVNEAPDLLAMTAQRKGQQEAVTAARRWLYTAVSRASDSVTVAVSR